MEDIFAPTGSPYFNRLAEAAREALGGSPGSLAGALAEMRDFLQAFRGQFERGMQVREPTPLAAEVQVLVQADLDRLEQALEQVESFLAGSDPELLLQGIGRGRQAVESMFAQFARLQEEERTFPVFSRSPYVHELVRVARGVAAGHFPAEALAEKLDWMLTRCRQTLEEQERMALLPGARPSPQAREHLLEMLQGLEEMGRYFQDGDVVHLEQGEGTVRRCAEFLVEEWEAQERADEPPTLPCPHCGQANPQGVRRCGRCSALLPELPPAAVALPGSALDLVSAEPRLTRPVPAYLVALEAAVQGVLTRTGSEQDLAAALRFMAESVQRGRSELASFRPPLGDRERVQTARQAVEAAADQASRGLERMQRYFQDRDSEHLRQGLEMVREAADKLVTAHEILQP
jgi:hypothetical protein